MSVEADKRLGSIERLRGRVCMLEGKGKRHATVHASGRRKRRKKRDMQQFMQMGDVRGEKTWFSYLELRGRGSAIGAVISMIAIGDRQTWG